MFLIRAWKKLKGSRSGPAAKPPEPEKPRRPIETLEDRRMLSAAPAAPYGPMGSATVGLTASQVKHADAVINWNGTMLQAIWNDTTPPTMSSRAMAIFGVAVFDAVSGIHDPHQMYAVPGLSGHAAHNANAQAAVIAAADTVLNALFPGQTSMFDAEYAATLAGVKNGRARDAGVAWGQTVGNAIVAWRAGDGWNATSDYQPAPAGGPVGVYELTPGVSTVLGAQWGGVTPWAMTSSQQFAPPAPPALNSAEYAASFNKTEAIGGTTSTVRTADQTQFAHFWADVQGKSVTPPGHWEEITEHVSLMRHLSLAQNARLFGAVGAGLADAAICCWGAKYEINFWRPVTAINDPRAASINPATASDPNWVPLWKTPNFPSYVSGHSTFSGSASAVLTAALGKDVHFSIGSDDMSGVVRSFKSFSAAADEAGESRVIGGIHFEFDNQAGLTTGRDLGALVAKKFHYE